MAEMSSSGLSRAIDHDDVSISAADMQVYGSESGPGLSMVEVVSVFEINVCMIRAEGWIPETFEPDGSTLRQPR